jgi:hypothetical protein
MRFSFLTIPDTTETVPRWIFQFDNFAHVVLSDLYPTALSAKGPEATLHNLLLISWGLPVAAP